MNFNFDITISTIVTLLGLLFVLYNWFVQTNVNSKRIRELSDRKLDAELYFTEKRYQEALIKDLKTTIDKLTDAVNKLSVKIAKLEK